MTINLSGLDRITDLVIYCLVEHCSVNLAYVSFMRCDSLKCDDVKLLVHNVFPDCVVATDVKYEQ